MLASMAPAGLGMDLPSILMGQIFGAPNNWRLDSSGKLVKDYETDEFKAGLSFLRDLWAAGVYHPNTMTYVNVAAGNDYRAGKFAFYYTLEDSFQNYWRDLSSNSDARTRLLPPFSADGSSSRSTSWASATSAQPCSRRPAPTASRNCLAS